MKDDVALSADRVFEWKMENIQNGDQSADWTDTSRKFLQQSVCASRNGDPTGRKFNL